MADLPITSDQGATPVVLTDATTTANTNTISATGGSLSDQGVAAATTAGWPTIGGNVVAVTAAWTSATAANTTLSIATVGYGTIALSFNTSAGTLTGGTLLFEASDDGGTTWYSIYIARSQLIIENNLAMSGFGGTSIFWQGNISGLTNFRVRLNPIITGTATVHLRLQALTFPCTPFTISQDTTKSTYSASPGGIGLAAAATDVFTITGSATKTITVTRMSISGTATAATNSIIQIIKRSTANSGGTATTAAAVPHDSNNAAATATIVGYTANPTSLGTAVGSSVRLDRIFLATTVTDSDHLKYDFGVPPSQPIVLRGTSQVLAFNFSTLTITGGNVDCYVEWTEE